MAIIEKNFAEIDDFDYSVQCIDLDRIIDAMHQKKTGGFLMFGLVEVEAQDSQAYE